MASFPAFFLFIEYLYKLGKSSGKHGRVVLGEALQFLSGTLGSDNSQGLTSLRGKIP